jgi:hypothetical protein
VTENYWEVNPIPTPFETVGSWPALAEKLAGEQPTYGQAQAVLERCHASITRRVEPYQRAVWANADSHLDEIKARRKAMAKLTRELQAVADMAEAGEDIDLNVWETAHNRAQRMLASPDMTDRVESIAHNLENPLDGLDDLERRTPGLRVKPFAV